MQGHGKFEKRRRKEGRALKQRKEGKGEDENVNTNGRNEEECIKKKE